MKGPLPPPFELVVGLAYERLAALARPKAGEPSPFARPGGGTAADWAEAGGLGDARPHEAIRLQYPAPMDCSPYDPATVAHTALQRLCLRAKVDRVQGLPLRYRAVRGRARRRR